MKRRLWRSRRRSKPYKPPAARKTRVKRSLLILAAVLLAALAAGTYFAKGYLAGQGVALIEKLMEAPSPSAPAAEAEAAEPGFAVHYIDVGEADASLIVCDGEAMLIDGGNKEDAGQIYMYLRGLGVDELQYIVATHPHEDHMGGLPGAMNYARVRRVLSPVDENDTVFFKTFQTYLALQDVAITVPEPGDTFTLGSAAVEVLGPIDRGTPYTNDLSIVLRVQYGDTSFLFTGDCEDDEEQTILASGRTVKSTVLKAGHHGSAFSTTASFLQAVDPDYAVIPVGQGNENGHPAPSLLRRLRDAGVRVYRTDLQGTVVCTSDGKSVSFSVERGQDAGTLAPGPAVVEPAAPAGEETAFILNTNTKKFHRMFCLSAAQMDGSRREIYIGTRDELIAMGYTPCNWCGE